MRSTTKSRVKPGKVRQSRTESNKESARGEAREMYIAMNRFRIALGHEEDFEKIWRERDSHLDEVPGFRSFDLLRGPVDEECTLYASHTIWAS